MGLWSELGRDGISQVAGCGFLYVGGCVCVCMCERAVGVVVYVCASVLRRERTALCVGG